MNNNKQDEQYPSKEIAQRRDDALRRALSMPPQPKLSPKTRKKKTKKQPS